MHQDRLLLQLFCGWRTATRTSASRSAAEIYRHADDHAFDRPIADLTRRYTLKRKSRTSPSFTTYSLPSLRMTPASRAAASDPHRSTPANLHLSARQQPRSKSE